VILHDSQQQPNWCWIACYRMACSNFNIAPPPQCTIAQQYLHIAGCCPPGSNPACDQTLPSAQIATLYDSAHLAAATLPVADSAFQQALSAGRLVLVLVKFPASYHFVLVGGFTNNQYVIHDPHYDASFPATFTQISNYPPQGSLDSAWAIDPRVS